MKQQRDLTNSKDEDNLQVLRVAQNFKKVFFIWRDPKFYYFLENSPLKFLQSTLSKCFISFKFTDLEYTFFFRWLSERKVPTFLKFVCNVITVLGKWDENCGGMTQYRVSLLGFHTSHSIFKYMFLVTLLSFLEDYFLFSLAETELTFYKLRYI